MKDTKSDSRIKNLRLQAGFSQEELAIKSELSLRTIQRIENGETVPRGDSLQRISRALNLQLADLKEPPVKKEDWRILMLLYLSALGFLITPVLGVTLPLLLWLLFKDKINHVSVSGLKIMKAQIYWLGVITAVYLFIFCLKLFGLQPELAANFNYKIVIIGIYCYNLIIVSGNIIKFIIKMSKRKYKPAISF